jgi:hypothetical protein
MRSIGVLMVLLAHAGACGDGGETVGLTGTGGAPMSAGTGGAGSTGGAGGAAPMGYGEITAADALVCEEWPLCPEGVFAFREGPSTMASPGTFRDLQNPMCGARGAWIDDGNGNLVCRPGVATDQSMSRVAGAACILPCKNADPGGCTRRTCGGCTDFRARSCTPFVARCRAPRVHALVCLPGSEQPNTGELELWDNGKATFAPGFFVQCTGDGGAADSLARVACGGYHPAGSF